MKMDWHHPDASPFRFYIVFPLFAVEQNLPPDELMKHPDAKKFSDTFGSFGDFVYFCSIL